MASSSDASRSPNTYFRSVGPFIYVLYMGVLIYFGWAALAPSTVPYDLLGPLGRFTKYLVENHKTAFQVGYLINWLLHLAQAVIVVVVCKKKGINDGLTQFRWSVQTFLIGFTSLCFLLIYKPPTKRQ